jgi:glutathione S-transferase
MSARPWRSGPRRGWRWRTRSPGPGRPIPSSWPAARSSKIPGFKDGDFQISDSTAIITYLEALHPEPNLIPTDPRNRARAIWFEEYADTIVVAAAGPLFFNRIVGPRFMGMDHRRGLVRQGRERDHPGRPRLSGMHDPGFSGFLLEDRLTLADIAVASPFANLGHLNFDLSPWPKTKAYAEAMLARPSFAHWVAREKRFLGG